MWPVLFADSDSVFIRMEEEKDETRREDDDGVYLWPGPHGMSVRGPKEESVHEHEHELFAFYQRPILYAMWERPNQINARRFPHQCVQSSNHDIYGELLKQWIQQRTSFQHRNRCQLQ